MSTMHFSLVFIVAALSRTIAKPILPSEADDFNFFDISGGVTVAATDTFPTGDEYPLPADTGSFSSTSRDHSIAREDLSSVNILDVDTSAIDLPIPTHGELYTQEPQLNQRGVETDFYRSIRDCGEWPCFPSRGNNPGSEWEYGCCDFTYEQPPDDYDMGQDGCKDCTTIHLPLSVVG